MVMNLEGVSSFPGHAACLPVTVLRGSVVTVLRDSVVTVLRDSVVSDFQPHTHSAAAVVLTHPASLRVQAAVVRRL